jgi:hypothetical protein
VGRFFIERLQDNNLWGRWSKRCSRHLPHVNKQWLIWRPLQAIEGLISSAACNEDAHGLIPDRN